LTLGELQKRNSKNTGKGKLPSSRSGRERRISLGLQNEKQKKKRSVLKACFASCLIFRGGKGRTTSTNALMPGKKSWSQLLCLLGRGETRQAPIVPVNFQGGNSGGGQKLETRKGSHAIILPLSRKKARIEKEQETGVKKVQRRGVLT